jgi:hypothetical protein
MQELQKKIFSNASKININNKNNNNNDNKNTNNNDNKFSGRIVAILEKITSSLFNRLRYDC